MRKKPSCHLSGGGAAVLEAIERRDLELTSQSQDYSSFTFLSPSQFDRLFDLADHFLDGRLLDLRSTHGRSAGLFR
jgi:hypothetical protein